MSNTINRIEVKTPIPLQNQDFSPQTGDILGVLISIAIVAGAYLVSDLKSKKIRQDAESVLIQNLSEQNELLQEEIRTLKAERNRAVNEIRILRRTLDYSGEGFNGERAKVNFHNGISGKE